jgi:hypothetical protein
VREDKPAVLPVGPGGMSQDDLGCDQQQFNEHPSVSKPVVQGPERPTLVVDQVQDPPPVSEEQLKIEGLARYVPHVVQMAREHPHTVVPFVDKVQLATYLGAVVELVLHEELASMVGDPHGHLCSETIVVHPVTREAVHVSSTNASGVRNSLALNNATPVGAGCVILDPCTACAGIRAMLSGAFYEHDRKTCPLADPQFAFLLNDAERALKLKGKFVARRQAPDPKQFKDGMPSGPHNPGQPDTGNNPVEPSGCGRGLKRPADHSDGRRSQERDDGDDGWLPRSNSRGHRRHDDRDVKRGDDRDARRGEDRGGWGRYK